MKKRILSLILAVVMTLTLIPTAFAVSDEAWEAADALHELGLFNGVGLSLAGTPYYDLDRVPNRNEAVTMLVRLLGKENEAKNGMWSTPFNDVDSWAKPYVGYAYTNGLVKGTSAITFGGDSPVTASQYLTLVLRALGYTSGSDFQWDKATELSDKIGITDGRYNTSVQFTRGDVAIISHKALYTQIKGEDKSLIETFDVQQIASEYKDCYEGTVIKTVTAVTGAICTGSYKNTEDLRPVKEEYVAGCERYSYSFEQEYTPFALDKYEQYFVPYIEYLDSLDLVCTRRPDTSLDGLMDETYNYLAASGEFIISWNVSSYTNRSWIAVYLK